MFLLVDKPSGCTSHDIVNKIKKYYGKRLWGKEQYAKVGHAGTLDPLATGLLIIAIGKDTKRLSEFVGLDKEYIATIDFSQKSDTRDKDHREYIEQLDINLLKETHRPSGTPLNSGEHHIPTQAEIEEKFESKLGVSQRPLTPFSAKKVKGKKLYEYAREGNPIFIDCDMELLGFEILSYEFPVCKVKLHVGSGTYIRSIAHWLGEQFGLGGILTALHRSKVGRFEV